MIEYSVKQAEIRAGVYDDDDGPEPCGHCETWPCKCDYLHDRRGEDW